MEQLTGKITYKKKWEDGLDSESHLQSTAGKKVYFIVHWLFFSHESEKDNKLKGKRKLLKQLQL